MTNKKNRIKFSKNILSLLLASTITMGTTITTGIVANLILDRKGPTKQQIQEENNKEFETNYLVGYNDLVVTEWNLDDNNFVILDIGDHDTAKIEKQEEKIKMCNDQDISLGVILSTTATNEAEIYNDVEYVKDIVSKYNINLPVYLNIDHIIENEELNIEMKTKIITNFLEKCRINQINIGIHGTDTNLCRLKEYFNITDYNAYVVMDKKTIKYDGKYSIIRDYDGNIKAKSLQNDLTEPTENNKENFLSDGIYILSTTDNITDISLRYGLSVEDILSFNNITHEDLKPGLRLRIPSVIGQEHKSEYGNFRKVENPIRGADISYAQGERTDWEKMAENFEFVIVRSSIGNKVDERFEENATNCNLYNIPLGIYCFNDVTNMNCESDEEFIEKQQEQLDLVLDLIKDKEITYPVYLDIEPPNNTDLKTLMTEEQVKLMLENWTTKIKEAGYIPGLYCNQSTYAYLATCVDYDLSEKLEIWIAGGEQYTGETISIDINMIKPSSVLEKDYNATIAQSTDSAINGGAANHRGHLDVNFSTVDYSDKLEDNHITSSIKQFSREEPPTIIEIVEETTKENKIKPSHYSTGLITLYGGAILASIAMDKSKKGRFER